MLYKNRFTVKSLACAAAALVAFPLTSFGIIPTQSDMLPLLTSPTYDESTMYTFKDITPFDTSKGTLVSVELTLTLYSTPFVTVYNSDMKAEGYSKATAKTAAAVKLLYSTTAGVGTIYVNSGVTTSGSFSGNEAAMSTSDPLSGLTTSKDSSYTIDDPGTFYSTGAYSLLTHLEEGEGFFSGGVTSGDPGVYFSGGDNLYETLSVDYFYTDFLDTDPVPEPSSFSLVALSLGALLLGRRLLGKRAQAVA